MLIIIIYHDHHLYHDHHHTHTYISLKSVLNVMDHSKDHGKGKEAVHTTDGDTEGTDTGRGVLCYDDDGDEYDIVDDDDDDSDNDDNDDETMI